MELFPFLLMPVLWENRGNIQPLVRLIQAYVRLGPEQIISLGKIEPLLGIFQKLIASKANDHEGFNLLQTMIEFMPKTVMANYNQGIFQLIFGRLTSSKTTKFIKSFLVFLSLFTYNFGGTILQELCDAIQPNLFGMVLERLMILEVQKVSGAQDRKICAVGMTKLLCETPSLLTGAYSQYWPRFLQALVGLFELPQDESIPEDERFIEIEETPGYQNSYSKLIFASKKDYDPLQAIQDPKTNLAQSLSKLSVGNPGTIRPLVNQTEPKVQEYLNVYLRNANVNLN